MPQYPSIFNDVIGPVMVGPSSSHTAGSVRVGRLVRQLAGPAGLRAVSFTFDSRGSLAATYRDQGVDFGLAAGLIGLETHDPAIVRALETARQTGPEIIFHVDEVVLGHPNTYHIKAKLGDGQALALTALSTGGGMVCVTALWDWPVDMDGGSYEAIILGAADGDAEKLARLVPGGQVETVSRPGGLLCRAVSPRPIDSEALRAVFPGALTAEPVLPVASQLEPSVPFSTAAEMLAYNVGLGLPLWQLATRYESARGGLSEEAVLAQMESLIRLLQGSLAGHSEADVPGRILQSQSQRALNAPMLGGSLERRVLYYVTRFMEIKSAMGVFVAAPTGGSCGCLAGTVFALGEELDLSVTDMAKAMLAGGLVGVLIAQASTFAAEVCGCQAECGAGSGMCAAACAQVLGLDAGPALGAASMALQSIFGMVCDPVAGKVEVPCLGKNILGAMNALASANMAAAGFDPVIPLDETIAAMDSVGKALPASLRCTGGGGLSVTPAAGAWEKRLRGE